MGFALNTKKINFRDNSAIMLLIWTLKLTSHLKVPYAIYFASDIMTLELTNFAIYNIHNIYTIYTKDIKKI